jgi:hypothetical protein
MNGFMSELHDVLPNLVTFETIMDAYGMHMVCLAAVALTIGTGLVFALNGRLGNGRKERSKYGELWELWHEIKYPPPTRVPWL